MVTRPTTSQKTATPPLLPTQLLARQPFKPSRQSRFFICSSLCLVSERMKTNWGLYACTSMARLLTVREFPSPRQFHTSAFIARDESPPENLSGLHCEDRQHNCASQAIPHPSLMPHSHQQYPARPHPYAHLVG